jgi:glycosyltransferase involved in cell wall biosynthesis
MVSENEEVRWPLIGDKKRGVLLLAGWYYPESVGGTEAYVHWLARDLQRRDFDVKVAAPSVDSFEDQYEYDGVPVYRYPVEQAPGISEVRGEIPPRHFEVFARWLEKEPRRLVHLHSMTRGCGFFHARHARALYLPLVVTVHVPGVVCARETMMRWGTTPCDGEMRTYRCATCSIQAQGMPRTIGWPLSLASRWTGPWAIGLRGRVASALTTGVRTARRHSRVRELLRIADRVVVVSQWLYDSLRQNEVSPEKLVLLRHGLPDEYLHGLGTVSTRIARKRLQIGFVGRIHPVKGLGVLVSAVRMLPPSTPIDLRVYGTARTDEDRGYLAVVRAAAGTDPRIVFHGEMTSSNRPDALRSLDILAVPSVLLETGPLVVMEAFAAGLPVVGSNVGGIAELVTDAVSGRLVEVGNVAAWARALRELSEQFMSGRWSWSIPPLRSSHEVTDEMLKIYRDAWGSFD